MGNKKSKLSPEEKQRRKEHRELMMKFKKFNKAFVNAAHVAIGEQAAKEFAKL